jgi:hypothetical protein
MVKTAREFYDEHYSIDAVIMMRDFAKLHVEAALKAASENVKVDYNLLENYNKTLLVDENIEVYAINSSILNAYPIENIK